MPPLLAVSLSAAPVVGAPELVLVSLSVAGLVEVGASPVAVGASPVDVDVGPLVPVVPVVPLMSPVDAPVVGSSPAWEHAVADIDITAAQQRQKLEARIAAA